MNFYIGKILHIIILLHISEFSMQRSKKFFHLIKFTKNLNWDNQGCTPICAYGRRLVLTFIWQVQTIISQSARVMFRPSRTASPPSHFRKNFLNFFGKRNPVNASIYSRMPRQGISVCAMRK